MILTANIYSPRWGHDDEYSFDLTLEAMTISRDAQKTKCIWREGLDPEWQGESLENIMRNDNIYPPAILPDLLEYLWRAVRNNELNQAQAQAELNAAADWLNTTTRAKPQTDFWRRYF